ncbi:MAG: helix-turn-helix domain-containing protein [Pseudomonadota bacterium]
MAPNRQGVSRVPAGKQSDESAIGRRVWTTDDVSESERFEYFCDAVCDAFMELSPSRSSSGGFRAVVESVRFASGGVNRVEGSTHSVERTRRQINRQDNSCFYLNVQLKSRCEIRQGDKQIALDPGQLALFDGARPFEIYHPEHSDMALASLQLPKDAVEDAARRYGVEVGQLGGVRVSDHPCLGPIIASTTRTIADRKTLLSAFDTDALFESLITLSVAACAGDRESANRENDELRPPMLLAIVEFIDQQLEREDLSVRTVASHFGISPRYVHKLFAQFGPSYSQFVRERRLDLAMNSLRDPRKARATISDVAFESGFSDLSNFNRRFKQHFGITPRDARRR